MLPGSVAGFSSNDTILRARKRTWSDMQIYTSSPCFACSCNTTLKLHTLKAIDLLEGTEILDLFTDLRDAVAMQGKHLQLWKAIYQPRGHQGQTVTGEV
eukprot:241787-Pelagomonas_calceolata.AAC.4